MRKLLLIISLLFSLASYSQVHQTFGAYADNLDSLYTHVGRQHQYVIVLGRFNANDGLGGIYIYDTSLTTTEVPYTNFKVIGKDTGRWSLVVFPTQGSAGISPNYAVLNILSAPPTPTLNAKYIVLTPGSGAWSGHDNNIATGTGVAWTFDTAVINQIASNAADNNLYIFNGSAWIFLAANLHQNGDDYGAIDIVAGNKQNNAFWFKTNDIIRGGFNASGNPFLYNVQDDSSPDSVLTIVDGEVMRAPYASVSGVTSVTATPPLTSSGGTTPDISITGVIPIANGGTNNGSLSVTNGNLIYSDGIKLVGLGVGTAGQHLVGGTLPHWVDTATSGGGTTTNALTMNNSGSGDASGTTFNGSAARTISYNSIGAVPTTRTVNGKDLSSNITLGLASSDFANQGTTTTVLHGNASGNPSFGAVGLTTDVTGTLPATNGGTGTATYTTGDILYASATNTLSKLSIGVSGQPLVVGGSGVPAWGTYVLQDSIIVNAPNLLQTLSNRLILRNPTAATNTAGQTIQYSPRLYLFGHGFYSGADHEVGFTIGMDPVASTLRPSLVIRRWADGAPTGDSITTTGGDLTTGGRVTAGDLSSPNLGVSSTTQMTLTHGGMNGAGTLAGTSVTSLAITKPNGTYISFRINPTINETTSTAANTMLQVNPQITSIGSGAFLLADMQYNNSSKWSIDKDGNVTQTRPIITSGSTPSNSAGTGAGTGPTISITGNDIAGKISITTGTIPTAGGDIVTISFSTVLTNTPTSIQLTPAGSNAATEIAKFYVDQSTVSSSSWKIKNTSSALTASTTYEFYYTVTQ